MAMAMVFSLLRFVVGGGGGYESPYESAYGGAVGADAKLEQEVREANERTGRGRTTWMHDRTNQQIFFQDTTWMHDRKMINFQQ